MVKKRLSLFWPQARESEDWATHTHRRSFIVFHVFDFIVTYLSLLQFAPWIVDRPHGGCWRWGGDKRDNGSSFRLRRRRKKAHCCWGPPPTSTLILHGCAFFFTLADSMAGDKSSSPFFFLFSSTWWRFFLFFYPPSQKYKPVRGKWPLTSPFLGAISVCLWNIMRVMAKVDRSRHFDGEWCHRLKRPGKIINLINWWYVDVTPC